MSTGKDVAPAMGADRVLKRPSSSSSSSSMSLNRGHHLSHPQLQSNYSHHHRLTSHQQRQQPKGPPANINSKATSLHLPSPSSRQTWTHSAFSRLRTESESNGNKGQLSQQQYHSQHGQTGQQQQRQTHANRLSLAGVCTVCIGPHRFLDTKFYTVVSSQYSNNSNFSTPWSKSPNLALKQEPMEVHPQKHQVAMEFKENPGRYWLFPDDASVEYTPANGHETAQILASFSLPDQEIFENGDRLNYTTNQTYSMTIMQATSALWEGLELAVTGSRIVTTRSSDIKSNSGTSRPHIPSTHSEDTSEILGSGKATKQPSSSNGLAKKQQDKGIDSTSKSAKPKQPKNQDDKGRGAANKGVGSATGAKKVSNPGSSANSSQKKCGYCSCTTTPMWRRGPHGPSTLCNACGVKWKHGKIMQDVTESQSDLSSGQNSGVTISISRSSNPRPSKESSGTGYNRQIDNKKTFGKSNNNGSSNKSTQDSSRDRSNSPQDKTSIKEPCNGGRRGSDADKIVPVKKRHLASSVSPPGPRMVPIHELDGLILPAVNTTSNRKHGYDGEEDDNDIYGLNRNRRVKQRKNGQVHSQPADNIHSTSSNTPLYQRKTSVDYSLAEDNLSLYASKNLYTNNAATFPLHFPTISIGFGPNNAYYTYPNCAVILFENHFQIKLIQANERTEIDVWKEGIEGTEFQVVDVGDGESMIVMKVLLRQYLTRFDKELLNPDRNESLIIFRFRERLDGGGPAVKPLLEHWLTTDIPVPLHPSQDIY
ncbi:hypothetical protein FBU30_002759 [Linnemannia zychae]|nr:hypothetical protein FBU30_002759 [Linnemannia zychae]